ncbi:MAG: hypothetical protein QF404_08670 [Planctomycetota bacterium]|nr:hypothetical protein [Planctomycetota bacterium]
MRLALNLSREFTWSLSSSSVAHLNEHLEHLRVLSTVSLSASHCDSVTVVDS